jgi:hypothetical protein
MATAAIGLGAVLLCLPGAVWWFVRLRQAAPVRRFPDLTGSRGAFAMPDEPVVEPAPDEIIDPEPDEPAGEPQSEESGGRPAKN